ncbi:MAG: hypothetical protein LWX70_05725 [Sphingobacteriia bacterium]|nr:hypothetical protein [Sphingobacteriia bacterium]
MKRVLVFFIFFMFSYSANLFSQDALFDWVDKDGGLYGGTSSALKVDNDGNSIVTGSIIGDNGWGFIFLKETQAVK